MEGLAPHEILLNMTSLRIPRKHYTPTQLPPTSLEPASLEQQQPFEETLDDDYTDTTGTSPTFSSVTSSRNSIYDAGLDGEDVEEVVRTNPPPCRRDVAHEVARSLWGLVRPKNFDAVVPGVFRSSYPKPENYSFLKTLGIKTVLLLVPEQPPSEYAQFMSDNGISLYQIPIEKNKTPFVTISQCNISSALSVILNQQNHPVLIHCNKGKHRTGCVVGCLRKVAGWSMESVISEYRHFAAEKARPLDERFLDLFNEQSLRWMIDLDPSGGRTVQADLVDESPITVKTAPSTRLRG